MSDKTVRPRRRALLAAALMGALAGSVTLTATAQATPQWRVIDLGIGDNSEAVAINRHGHVVGNQDGRVFVWRAGQVTWLDLGGDFATAADINSRDEVVGHRNVAGVSRAFLWRGGVLTDLGVLPGGTSSFAHAINDRGEVVGLGTDSTGANRAFRWRDGVMTDLGTLPGAGSSGANDINNRGVAVGQSGPFDQFATRWRPGAGIEQLATVPTSAKAVNDRGYVTGLLFGGQTHGFVWNRGRLTEIQPPEGETFLQPFGINNWAQVVGHTDRDAFVWQHGRITLLPRLVGGSVAHDINDRGQIAGFSTVRPEGLNRHAVLWTR